MGDQAEARVKALTDRLESGISQVFQSSQYAEYLSAMSKFHQYSFGNSTAIISDGCAKKNWTRKPIRPYMERTDSLLWSGSKYRQ